MQSSTRVAGAILMMAAFLMTSTLSAEETAPAAAAEEVARLVRQAVNASPTEGQTAMQRALSALSSGTDVELDQDTTTLVIDRFHADLNRDIILLAGLARIDALAEEMRAWASQPIEEPGLGRFDGKRAWAANLMLARQGDPASLANLLEAAENQDPQSLLAFLLSDFQYVPQPEIVAFLWRYLDSDERLETPDPRAPGIPLANYAAYSLARILRGFPLDARDDYGYSEAEIAACRHWMSRQRAWHYRLAAHFVTSP